MRFTLNRYRIAALVAFFPLAVVGILYEKRSLQTSLTLYYICLIIFSIFMMFLAVYTYTQGGNFIPPLGTFY